MHLRVIYLHHVIQTVKDVLPGFLRFDAHLHLMLCWSLVKKTRNMYLSVMIEIFLQLNEEIKLKFQCSIKSCL